MILAVRALLGMAFIVAMDLVGVLLCRGLGIPTHVQGGFDQADVTAGFLGFAVALLIWGPGANVRRRLTCRAIKPFTVRLPDMKAVKISPGSEFEIGWNSDNPPTPTVIDVLQAIVNREAKVVFKLYPPPPDVLMLSALLGLSAGLVAARVLSGS